MNQGAMNRAPTAEMMIMARPPDGFSPSFQVAHYASLMSPTWVQVVTRMQAEGRNPGFAGGTRIAGSCRQ